MNTGSLANYKKPAIQWLIVLLVLCPLLFINIRHSQQWGDDFALYILQAKNICEGKAFDNTGVVYVDKFTSIVGSAPVGFSLMLVPVYYFFGNNIFAFEIYLAVIYVLWAVLSYVFFRKYFSFFTCLALLFIGFYPNFMMWMKILVTSDIPFSLLFLAATLIYLRLGKLNRWQQLALAILVGFMMCVRSIGFTFVIAVGAHQLLLRIKKKDEEGARINFVLLFAALAISAGTYLLINNVVFPMQHSYVGYSFNQLQSASVLKTIAANITIYNNNFTSLFNSDNPSYHTFSNVIKYLMLALLLTGFIYRFIFKTGFIELLTIFYVAVLLVYPVAPDYRYVVPVHPFLLYYIAIGGWLLTCKLGSVNAKYLAAPVVVAVAMLFDAHLEYLWRTRTEGLPGPYEEVSQQTFDYIAHHVSDSDIIVCEKPRAVALYTGKRTTSENFNISAAENYAKLKQMGARYYLYSWMIHDADMKKLLDYRSDSFDIAYKNWQFTLYKDNK